MHGDDKFFGKLFSHFQINSCVALHKVTLKVNVRETRIEIEYFVEYVK